MIPVPTFCRIERLNPEKGWTVMHAGINLLDPQRYVTGMAKRQKNVRVIDLDTGEEIYPQCGLCSEKHLTGTCLL